MRNPLVILGLLVGISQSALGQSWSVSSGSEQVPLVELYSSEGCSSCPPADAFFTKLRSRSGLWKSFVPIAFHVDYWDRLGWVDKLASRRFTRRQYAYAALWKTKNVYTPELVYQGQEWKGWRKGAFPSGGSPKVGKLTLKARPGGKFDVDFATTQKGAWDVHVAVLGNGVTSEIKSGENSGRTLQHDFVVLAWGQAPTRLGKNGVVSSSLTLKPATKVKVPKYAAVAWVTEKGKLVPVQSTGGDLPGSLVR